MAKYIHELAKWPALDVRSGELTVLVAVTAKLRGELRGRVAALGLKSAEELRAGAIATEAVKSSEIEGEHFDFDAVRSSIARRLGLDAGGAPLDRRVEGIVEVGLDVASRYSAPLTEQRLFNWHGALFPTGYGPLGKIAVGTYRDDREGPMQVVSKAGTRKQVVHYEAPPALRLGREMELFLHWFEEAQGVEGAIKSALAHLWFVTIHPFEDGNGRIGRAILDLALARDDDDALRAYSVSAQIQAEKKDYYDALEKTQKGSLDVTEWVAWCLGCFARAVRRSLEEVDGAIQRERFWGQHRTKAINKRQRKVVALLLFGLEGKLTNKKYRKLTDVSDATATRDLSDLVLQGFLVRRSESKGSFYELSPENEAD
jgi:Fic family protein